MSIEPFAKGIPEAAAKLAATEAGSHDAATAIMTTDTHSKEGPSNSPSAARPAAWAPSPRAPA